ncbi:MAG TPA: ATP synthase F1 subunit delta [Ignavibacteriaceae bacterium]|nr:ATP synthase F1 subunit delta [Ignavibacteriaceae bacterium]
MTESKVSTRYANSLLESSLEKRNIETISKDMDLVYSAIKGNSELARALASPIVKPGVKSSILEEIFKSKVSKETMEFLNFIVEKGREDLLASIVQKFLELMDKHNGIVNVNVRSAVELAKDQREKLKQNFEKILNKKVRLNFIIDQDVVGGFVAKVGDTVYDASLKHQLEILKKRFQEGGASLN